MIQIHRDKITRPESEEAFPAIGYGYLLVEPFRLNEDVTFRDILKLISESHLVSALSLIWLVDCETIFADWLSKPVSEVPHLFDPRIEPLDAMTVDSLMAYQLNGSFLDGLTFFCGYFGIFDNVLKKEFALLGPITEEMTEAMAKLSMME